MSSNRKAVKVFLVCAVCCLMAANVFGFRKQLFYASFEDSYQSIYELRVPTFVCSNQSFTSELVVNGSPGTLVSGVAGKALPFSGTQYLQVPDNSCLDLDSGDFYISFWVKTTSSKGNNTIIDKRNSSGRGYHVTLYNGRPLLRLSDSVGGGYNYYNSSGVTVNDGNWHFVYIYVDVNGNWSSKIYVDGAVTYTFNPTRHSGSLANTSPLYIGKHSTSSSNGFVGTLDELRFVSQ